MPDQSILKRFDLNTPSIVYMPSEMLGIIVSYFSQQDVNMLIQL